MTAPAPLAPSTANWHWKNKNVTRWGKEWFERELTTISIAGGDKEGEVVAISSVTDVDGDIELGQRKSKLITIFDCKVVCAWKGTATDGTEVKGTVTIPEVSHEITLDGLSDYVYQWTLTTASSPAAESLFSLAKSRLPTALETKFAEFAVALVDTHGKDLTVSGDPSRSGTPAPAATASTSEAASATAAPPAPKPAEKKSNINTTKITVEGSFMAAADDLFGLLTDEKRIPNWTRSSAKSEAKPDTDYVLFGGGVKGKYVSLTPPSEIVQTWALQSPTWPAGHYATMTTTIVQGSDSTTVTFTLTGVPTGMEEELKRNVEGYYIQGFKSIGLGSSLS
ncbi:activator of Hsp90 ATPase [Mycena rebaudengoi]|nr:activator of Hsp90 ATPase [Mycena rebaudengoi]